MKTAGIGGSFLVVVFCCVTLACGQNEASVAEGERLFKLHCQACHPNGKNIVNPAKTLYAQDLKKSNRATPEAIVNIIRKAPPGMTTFDGKVISDNDADAIARYILRTFQ